jgi:hypothetical protein
MSPQDRVLDLSVNIAEARTFSEEGLARLRQQDAMHRHRGLLVIYPIEARSSPYYRTSAGSKNPRTALDAADTVIGIGLVFPGEPNDRNRIGATHMAVSLADVETVSYNNEIINTDTEEGGE